MSLPEIEDGRLLIDPPAAGPWNMAVDEVLLENADQGELSVRFYAWTPTTLSLGYFQSVQQRSRHDASRLCPLVRRASGGGAIIHDDDPFELTYCVALPGTSAARGARLELYDTIHHSLIVALSELGVRARSCSPASRPSGQEPFLCFQRRTEGDVLVGDHKVAGSAQRRSAHAVLQHGSVLLSQSPRAPELPGIAQLSGVRITGDELRDRWLSKLQDRWPVCWQPSMLSRDERARAAQKTTDKFSHHRWTDRR